MPIALPRPLGGQKRRGREVGALQQKVRVAVVDDFRISRQFFEAYVKSAPGYELAWSLPFAGEAVARCAQEPPQLLILDVLMRSGMDGLTAAEAIKGRQPEVRIILATSTAEATWEEKARRAGVEGFWYKEYSQHSLLEIMDRVMAGERVYPQEAPDMPFGRVSRSDLTERELDVLRELTGGYTTETIAQRLGITVNTVRYHVQNILNKTGFESRLELAMNAKLLGLVVNERDRLEEGPEDGA